MSESYYFDGKQGFQRVSIVYGNTNDYYMTLTRGWYSIGPLLESHLKMMGYKVVLFCDGFKTLWCYDQAHAENRRRYFPLKSEKKPDATPTGQLTESAPEGAGTMLDYKPKSLGGKRGVSGRRASGTEKAGRTEDASRDVDKDAAPLRFEYSADRMPEYLDGIMNCTEVPCAIIFNNASVLFTAKKENEAYAAIISRWYGLRANNGNIAILLFQEPELEALPKQLESSVNWRFLYEHVFTENEGKNARIRIGGPHEDEVFYLLNARCPEFRRAETLRGYGTDESEVLAAAHRATIQRGGKLSALLNYITEHPTDLIPSLLKEFGNNCEEDALEVIRNTEGWEEIAKVIDRIIDAAHNQRHDRAKSPFRESTMNNQRMARETSFARFDVNLCMILKGRPGTGKTTAAQYIGNALRQHGLLPSGHFVKVERADVVAGFVGQTALKTRGKLDEAYGGVLLVDEAYTLNKKSSNTGGSGNNDFGIEAIETLMSAILNMRGEICIIFAGYPERMDDFLKTNDGLTSRFGNNIITIPDYGPDLLERIALKRIARYNEEKVKSGRIAQFRIDGWLGSPVSEKSDGKSYEPLELAELCRQTRATGGELCPLSIYFDNLYADRDVENFGNAREAENVAEYITNAASKRIGQRAREIIIHREDFPEETRHYFIDRSPSVAKIRQQLDDIVGLKDVKEQLIRLAGTLEVHILKRKLALRKNEPSKVRNVTAGNYLFVGNPGVGKTMVAKKLAQILCSMGLVRHFEPVRVQGNDLIGIYRKKDAEGMREFVKEHSGRVVIIDEAHQLGEYNLGGGVLQGLLDAMSGDDANAQICFIFNCYPNRLKQLLGTEEGTERRIGTMFYFSDYDAQEVYEIFLLKLKAEHYTAETDALSCVLEKLEILHGMKGMWQNGGTAEKLLRKAIENQSNRLLEGTDPEQLLDMFESGVQDENILYTLTKTDIEAGFERLVAESMVAHRDVLGFDADGKGRPV